MPLEPGATIDRYVIESLLGVGGMGEVYRARDTRLQRSVALKVLRDVPDSTGSNQSAGGAERLLREARAAAALEHANVVAVFDVGHVEAPGSANGMTYLAMELIKGSSLRAYVGDASVPMSERLRWLTDIARGLGAAHRAGLVHRDIKPENVMIREDGAVKVLDFGIARRTYGTTDPASSTAGQSLATMTARGVVVGTPQYMAPEQLRAEQLDGGADQFAWGVVAYELLAGRAPWTLEEGAIALVGQILSREPPPLETVADVPEHVAKTIGRALRKDRAARFPSMDVLVEALSGKIDALGKFSLPPPQPESTTNPLAATQKAQGKADAFASAPTEAVMTPAPSRRSGERTEPPLARPARGPRTMTFALLVVGLLGAASWAVTKLRASGSTPVMGEGGGASAQSGGCASNKGCIEAHGGEPWLCRTEDRQCASLASPDCSVLAEPGDVELDSTVWFGALFPETQGEKETLREARSNLRAADLARRDFAETLGKIGSARHIGIVSCDASVDVKRAALHLAEDLRVPAVLVGTTHVADIIEVVPKILVPRNVLSMITLSASPLVTALPQGPSGRLVYRSTYSSEYLLAPTANFVETVLEPQLRHADGSKRVRLAFLHEKSLAASVFYDRLLTILHFNGKSVIDNGDDFRDVAYEDEARSYDGALGELARFKPDLVLARVSPGAIAGVIAPLERKWPAATPRPTFLLSMPLLPEMLELVASDAARRRRFFGMDNISTTTANVQLVNHYNQTFDDRLSRTDAPGTTYDAFYALAYAVHAVGDAPVTGPSIARGFRRLAGPGATFLVGPQPIFDAYRDLVSGANIDLEGTSGHLDLDPSSGESTAGIGILCAAPPEGGAPARAIESGLLYEEKTHGFTGALACP